MATLKQGSAIVLSSLAAALAIVLWGCFFWNCPLVLDALRTPADAGGAASAIRAEFPESGTYLLPGPGTSAETREGILNEGGPIATISVNYGAIAMSRWGRLLGAFAVAFAAALLLNLAAYRVRSAFRHYRQRLLFITVTGGAGSLLPTLFDPIWWAHPIAWQLVRAFFYLTAWTWAALVLAPFVKRKPAHQSSQDAGSTAPSRPANLGRAPAGRPPDSRYRAGEERSHPPPP